MDEDSGEEFSAKALQQATKRKFDYSFSSSSENENDNGEEENKDYSEGDESADDIKEALFVQKPPSAMMQLDLDSHGDKDLDVGALSMQS